MNWIIYKASFQLLVVVTLVLRTISGNTFYKNHLQTAFNQGAYRKEIFKQFLQQIDEEENYKTCIIFGESMPEYAIEEILQKDLNKTIVLHKTFQNITKCCGSHTHFLIMVHWHEEKSQDLLRSLAEILNFKRYNKIVVVKNKLEKDLSLTLINTFFNFCTLIKLVNLVLIFKDFYKTHNLYQFPIYPQLGIQKINILNNSLVIFPKKMKNIYGAALRTIPDQVLPRTAAIIDQQGQLQVKGYVMKFLLLFTKYINATLEFPFNITVGRSLDYLDILNLTQQDVIDVPASLSGCVWSDCFSLMSDYYEMNKWCIMVPREKPYNYEDYINMLCKKVWSLRKNRPYIVKLNDVVINTDVMAGMFASSFTHVSDPLKSMRLIYFLISITGLIHYILIGAKIQSFLTHPYSYRIQSLTDLSFHNLRLLIVQSQYDFVQRYFEIDAEEISPVFKIVPDFDTYFEILSSLNTSYAYAISSPLWFMYDALQIHLNKPIFRLTHMCQPYTGMTALILPPNSLFKEPLNELIARVRDMGILHYWLQTSYIDMLKMKKIIIPNDLSAIKKDAVLSQRDFNHIWLILFRNLFGAFMLFLGEILWYNLCKKN